MIKRPRRNRRTSTIRNLVQETTINIHDLVLPLFLVPGEDTNQLIESLPIASRLSLDYLLQEIDSCVRLGINTFVLFPSIPEEHKDKYGTYSYAEDNFYLKSAQVIKHQFPDICLISDVALDPYSIDGHDGVVQQGIILNDQTLPILDKMSVAQAQAGFDIIAPSDMMDGRICSIRKALDQAGFTNTGIMAYSAKYASGFYGPFRDALDSTPKLGDKKTYQMNPANRREALIEGKLDIAEGADYIMVKPALHYLDIINDFKTSFNVPIAAYHVSGECAQLIAGCKLGWLDYDTVMPEVVLSIKRAGADIIITYFAKDLALRLNQSLG